MDFLAPLGALGALEEKIFLVCLYVQILTIFDSFLSYGLQTEFSASIVLEDVRRVPSLFFAKIIMPLLEKMPEAIFPDSKVCCFELWPPN